MISCCKTNETFLWLMYLNFTIALNGRRLPSFKYKKEWTFLDIVTEISTTVLCSLFWSAWGLSWMDWNKENKRFPQKTILSATLNTRRNASYSEQTLVLRENGITGLYRLSIRLNMTYLCAKPLDFSVLEHQCNKIAQHLKHVWLLQVLNYPSMWQFLCLEMFFLIWPETFNGFWK